MYDLSGELNVILITIWWLHKLGNVWQEVKQQHRILIGERFNLRKLNELEVRKQYQIKISNSFASLKNLSDKVIART
jgi:predicted rRNA methylase YqxC with S4 and FtsJ domains